MDDLQWKLFEMTGRPEFYLMYKNQQVEQLRAEGKNEHQRPDYPGDGFWRI